MPKIGWLPSDHVTNLHELRLILNLYALGHHCPSA
jgi:hypothetical protein